MWLPIDIFTCKWGSDKSLARPGRKKLQRPNSNFCKPLKKKIIRLSVKPGLRSSNDFRVRRKIQNFNCFSVQGADGSPTGPDPENRVNEQDIGSPSRPVSSGLQVSGEPEHCRARTSIPLVTYPRLLSFKMFFNYTSMYAIRIVLNIVF